MLSDRPYMRGDYQRETTSVATWVMCAIAGAFVIQFAADSRWFAPLAGLSGELSLSIAGLADGRVWTLLTHWLMHRTDNLLHVGLVLAGLYLLRREMAEDLSSKRFVAVFGSGVLVGALTWTALNWWSGGELMGATAGLGSLVVLYALLHPRREVRFLLFFFFPLTIRPKHLAVAWLALDALALLFVKGLGRDLPFSYAPSAHLGGMFVGWMYYRYFHAYEWGLGQPPVAVSRQPNQVMSEGPSFLPSPPSTQPADRTREDLRAQVDRILDKINSEGLGALTPTERRTLDEAKDLLSRR